MMSLGSRAASPAVEESLAPRADEAWPFYDEDEIAAVAAVLRSGKVNQWTGPDVFAFQDACREVLGGGPGIALANGSLALELPMRAFGIGPGDEVVTTPPGSRRSGVFCARRASTSSRSCGMCSRGK